MNYTASIRLHRADGITQVLLKEPACLIGSAPDCDIVLTQVPSLAAEITLGKESCVLKSLSAITVNGQLLTEKSEPPTVTLNSGDRLLIAEQVFTFESQEIGLASSQGNSTETLVKKDSQATQRSQGYLEALQEFARAAAEESDVAKVLEASLATSKKALQATDAFVFILGPDGQPQAIAGLDKHQAEDRFSDSVVQTVLQEGKALLLAQANQDERFSSSQSISELKLSSVICAPVLLGGKVTGCVYLGTRKIQVTYGKEDLKALQAFAQFIGLLVHNADFMARQTMALRELTAVDETGLLAQSAAMLKVLREADAIAAADISVLIQGETGTGKELIAERLHRRSHRAKGPLVAVNCSSLRGELLESELFGYKRGAFTGALQDKQGLFAAAKGGTLFLDEVGELDVALQAKLLRALETGKIRPVGATQEEAVDVRVISATHRDIKSLISEKVFRDDLYYRLAPVTLLLPALRERQGDIALLAHAFLEKFKVRYPAKNVSGFHPQSLRAMNLYAWPGNIRELLNAVHKAVLLSPGPLLEVDLGTRHTTSEDPEFLGFDEATTQFQKQYISEALGLVDGNREQAAKALKMSRSTFFRYLAQLGVE